VRVLPITFTRSSAFAEGPRDASCQLKSCQLPGNSAETTCTTSPVLHSAQKALYKCPVYSDEYIGSLFIGSILYAHDIALLACSCYGLQQLINICNKYGMQYWISDLIHRIVSWHTLAEIPLVITFNTTKFTMKRKAGSLIYINWSGGRCTAGRPLQSRQQVRHSTLIPSSALCVATLGFRR